MRDRLDCMGAPERVLVLWDMLELVGAASTLATSYRSL